MPKEKGYYSEITPEESVEWFNNKIEGMKKALNRKRERGLEAKEPVWFRHNVEARDALLHQVKGTFPQTEKVHGRKKAIKWFLKEEERLSEALNTARRIGNYTDIDLISRKIGNYIRGRQALEREVRHIEGKSQNAR